MAPVTERDKKALLIFGGAVVVWAVLEFGVPSRQAEGPAPAPSIQKAENRLRQLQATAAQRAGAAADAESARASLAEAEKGLLKGTTAALASAEMQQIVKAQLGRQGIALQSSEFGEPKRTGDDYAAVPLSVSFTCGIEQWINLMAGLRNAPEVLSTLDVRISPGDPKTKAVQVRMTVAGYIPASLVPAPKSSGA